MIIQQIKNNTKLLNLLRKGREISFHNFSKEITDYREYKTFKDTIYKNILL